MAIGYCFFAFATSANAQDTGQTSHTGKSLFNGTALIGWDGDPVELEKKISRDGWNEMRVIARGFTFTHIINGQVMSMALDEDKTSRKASGLIAFQLHSGPAMKIRLKDITVRNLSE